VNTPKIDPELLAKLKELGIDPTSDQPKWVDLPATEVKDLPSIQQHRATLEQLRDALRKQLEGDLEQLDALRLERERLKNGGGT
jgi:hypothetical protein